MLLLTSLLLLLTTLLNAQVVRRSPRRDTSHLDTDDEGCVFDEQHHRHCLPRLVGVACRAGVPPFAQRLPPFTARRRRPFQVRPRRLDLVGDVPQLPPAPHLGRAQGAPVLPLPGRPRGRARGPRRRRVGREGAAGPRRRRVLRRRGGRDQRDLVRAREPRRATPRRRRAGPRAPPARASRRRWVPDERALGRPPPRRSTGPTRARACPARATRATRSPGGTTRSSSPSPPTSSPSTSTPSTSRDAARRFCFEKT